MVLKDRFTVHHLHAVLLHVWWAKALISVWIIMVIMVIMVIMMLIAAREVIMMMVMRIVHLAGFPLEEIPHFLYDICIGCDMQIDQRLHYLLPVIGFAHLQ